MLRTVFASARSQAEEREDAKQHKMAAELYRLALHLQPDAKIYGQLGVLYWNEARRFLSNLPSCDYSFACVRDAQLRHLQHASASHSVNAMHCFGRSKYFPDKCSSVGWFMNQ